MFVSNFTLNFNNIKKEYFEFYDKSQSEIIKKDLVAQQELQKIVKKDKKKLTMLIDYRAPVIYSGIRENITSHSIFDNISIMSNWNAPEYDYILLHKDSKLFLNNKDFNNYINNLDVTKKETLNESKKILTKLTSKGIFKNSHYKIVFKNEKLILYKKDAV